MTGKYPFVLDRLLIEQNRVPLLENNVVLTLHYVKIMGLTQWQGHPSGFYKDDKDYVCMYLYIFIHSPY